MDLLAAAAGGPSGPSDVHQNQQDPGPHLQTNKQTVSVASVSPSVIFSFQVFFPQMKITS